jgi:kumamolisin
MTAHVLAGSVREPLAGARLAGKASPKERLEVTVLVRRQNADAFKAKVAKLAAGDRSQTHLSHAEFARQFGASPVDMAAVEEFARRHDLAVVDEDAARRTVTLSGTVARFNSAFAVDLLRFEFHGGTYRGRAGPIAVPGELNGIVEAVLGLDNRPQVRPHFRARITKRGFPAGFTPTTLASLYDFPSGTGKGVCIALIELGGGYRLADLQRYFSDINSALPKVCSIAVNHARNHATGDPNGPDGEVMLDIEVAGTIAPEAEIVVYFAPNTDAGFFDAVSTAIHDDKNKPSVISISWGGPEASWTPQAMAALDQAFQAAALMGITVCVASGDNGSSGGIGDAGMHVDFPAASPHVLACGGTSLQAVNGDVRSETVWNNGVAGGASGGGVSCFFPLPPWQDGLQLTNAQGRRTSLRNRGVPDVSGEADPQTGYFVRVDGINSVIGGTSAVAPLWAGLVARINAAKGSPVGFINPHLYRGSGLNDVTYGDNGGYAASIGWDACSGLGTPDGRKIAGILGVAGVAGEAGFRVSANIRE